MNIYKIIYIWLLPRIKPVGFINSHIFSKVVSWLVASPHHRALETSLLLQMDQFPFLWMKTSFIIDNSIIQIIVYGNSTITSIVTHTVVPNIDKQKFLTASTLNQIMWIQPRYQVLTSLNRYRLITLLWLVIFFFKEL